jgi:hypothetical protein
MASNINPNNIDGAYPVAGQDNDSQGFRDNFTNTRTNFAAAAAEITDLQNKAILTAPLIGTVNPPSPWVNNLGGSFISNGVLRQVTGNVVTVTTNNASLDFSAASFYKISPSGNTIISFNNTPAAGRVGVIRAQINTVGNIFNVTTDSITITGNIVGGDNIQGLDGNVLTFNTPGVYEYEFEFSAGSPGTVTMIDLNRNRDPLYLPSVEIFAANANISLNVTTTVITVDSDIVATLNPGIEGQIKILAYGNANPGNALVTVTESAWGGGGSGIANLSATGSACTLQYINGSWFCVGNNGVSFS